MANWRRITGVAGLAAGAAVAAGAGVVLAAEKVAVGRIRLRPDPDADEPFGRLRGRGLTVLADDGVPLHAEISGRDDAPVTIIFCHGYALSQDVWHYQRAALGAGPARLLGSARSRPVRPCPARSGSASTSSARTCTRCWRPWPPGGPRSCWSGTRWAA